MGLIRRAELKNTVIIALVIAMCLALMIYFHGFKQVINSVNAVSDVNDSISESQNQTTS